MPLKDIFFVFLQFPVLIQPKTLYITAACWNNHEGSWHIYLVNLAINKMLINTVTVICNKFIFNAQLCPVKFFPLTIFMFLMKYLSYTLIMSWHYFIVIHVPLENMFSLYCIYIIMKLCILSKNRQSFIYLLFIYICLFRF